MGFLDIRIEKTERAIKQAFMELRAQKPLEKIKVKELCDLACINKSTFMRIIRISMRWPTPWRTKWWRWWWKACRS